MKLGLTAGPIERKDCLGTFEIEIPNSYKTMIKFALANKRLAGKYPDGSFMHVQYEIIGNKASAILFCRRALES